MDHLTEVEANDVEVLDGILARDSCKRKAGDKPPYKILSDPHVGRYIQENMPVHVVTILYHRHMVASRKIKSGEIIFKDRPLTFGPSEGTKPVCLGCYKCVTNNDYSLCYSELVGA